MEGLYQFPKNEIIKINNLLNDFTQLLKEFPIPKNDEDIKRMMGTSDEEFEKLKDSISLEKLEIENAVPITEFDPEKVERNESTRMIMQVQNDPNLETTKELLAFREKIKARHSRKREYPFGRTEFNYKIIKHEHCEPQPGDLVVQPYKDVIISIRIYRPFRYILGTTTYGPSFQEEYAVLGSQYLTELRDKISCDFKEHMIEISSQPDKKNPPLESNSGFFFITDTFYNDTRNPKNCDYSQHIKTWLSSQSQFKDIEYKTAKMEETKFCDLNVRVGFPQVYLHNGNCEHLFCISAIELTTPDDNLRIAGYPLLKSVSIKKYTVCNMCGIREYSYMVKGSRRQFCEPTRICQQCFKKFFYIKGKKIENFKAYRITLANDDEDEDENFLDGDENLEYSSENSENN